MMYLWDIGSYTGFSPSMMWVNQPTATWSYMTSYVMPPYYYSGANSGYNVNSQGAFGVVSGSHYVYLL